MSTFNEKQQKAFVDPDWAWSSFPKWVKAISYSIGLPVFLAMVYLIFAGEGTDSPKFIYLSVIFGAVCILQIVMANLAFRKLGKDD